MNETLYCTFPDWEQARSAVDHLLAAGFERDAISIVALDDRGADEASASADITRPHAVMAGAATGGAVGFTGGWMLGLAALTVPGIGPVLAAGPLMGAITGLAVGAGTGGLWGALFGEKIKDDEAEVHQRALGIGYIMVAVHADDRYEEARDILRSASETPWDGAEDEPDAHPVTDYAVGGIGSLAASPASSSLSEPVGLSSSTTAFVSHPAVKPDPALEVGADDEEDLDPIGLEGEPASSGRGAGR